MVTYKIKLLKTNIEAYEEQSSSPIQSAFDAAHSYVTKCSKKNADIEVTNIYSNKIYYYKIVDNE